MLSAVESEVDVEWEGGGDGEGEVGHRGHQIHPAWPREVLGTVQVTADQPKLRGSGVVVTLVCEYGAVHILRKHILGSLNTLGGVVSAW